MLVLVSKRLAERLALGGVEGEVSIDVVQGQHDFFLQPFTSKPSNRNCGRGARPKVKHWHLEAREGWTRLFAPCNDRKVGGDWAGRKWLT